MNPIKIITTIRNSFIGSTHIYTHGSCYHFYLILLEIFPDAVSYNNDNHVITRIGNKYYDITGEIENDGSYEIYDPSKIKLHNHPFSLWDAGLECPNCDEMVCYGELLVGGFNG